MGANMSVGKLNKSTSWASSGDIFSLNGKTIYKVSPAARTADAYGYGATMSAKRSALNKYSATATAESAAALTNQSGGNIGFTYE